MHLKLSAEKVDAIRQFYEANRETPRQSMKLKEVAAEIGISVSAMRNYGAKMGLLNPNRRQYSESPRIAERYTVDPETGCWVWILAKSVGYGKDFLNGKRGSAHRMSYEQHKGPIPEGAHLDHLCRNPACINPDHLEPVTCAENIRRGDCAKLTREQVLEIRSRLSAGERQFALALEYEVDASTISLIFTRKRWKGVEL